MPVTALKNNRSRDRRGSKNSVTGKTKKKGIDNSSTDHVVHAPSSASGLAANFFSPATRGNARTHSTHSFFLSFPHFCFRLCSRTSLSGARSSAVQEVVERHKTGTAGRRSGQGEASGGGGGTSRYDVKKIPRTAERALLGHGTLDSSCSRLGMRSMAQRISTTRTGQCAAALAHGWGLGRHFRSAVTSRWIKCR